MKQSLVDLYNYDILPALSTRIADIFPEFQFRKVNDHFVSGNGLKLTGETGEVGKVAYKPSRPFFLQDWTRDGMAVTTYLINSSNHNVSNWKEAVLYLAQRLNISVSEESMSQGDIDDFKEKIRLAEIKEAVNNFLVQSLNGKLDFQDNSFLNDKIKSHRDYLHSSRGYSDDVIAKMELGFVPSKAFIKNYLTDRGYNYVDIDNVLSAIPQRVNDEFGLSLPLRDISGKILGFVFRDKDFVAGTGSDKYCYTVGLKRDDILFNLRSTEDNENLTLVEGLYDAPHCRAVGIPGVVCLGSATLGEKQIDFLKRHGCKKITLFLDNDKTGTKNTPKTIEKLLKAGGFKIYVGTLPSGIKDPDELIVKHGKDAFVHAIRHASAWYDARLGGLAHDLVASEGTQKDKDHFLKGAVDLAATITDPLEKADYKDTLTKLLDAQEISPDGLDEAVARAEEDNAKKQREENFQSLLTETQRLAREGKVKEAAALYSEKAPVILSSRENRFADLIAPVANAEAALKNAMINKLPGLKSGLHFGKEELEFPPAAITAIVGPTSHGKTTFLNQVAITMATTYPDKKLVYFSYEEDKDAITLKLLNTFLSRSLSSNNRKTLQEYFRADDPSRMEHLFRDGLLTPSRSKEAFFRDIIETKRLSVHYANYNSQELVEAIRYLKSNNAVDAVLLDYIQLLRLPPSHRANSRQEELKQICIELKDCAVSTGLPIILTAQFNRTVVSEADLSPTNIGEAGDIERIAALIIGFWNRNFEGFGKDGNRDKNNNKIPKESTLFTTILKGREIPAGAAEVFKFDGNTGTVKSRSITKGNVDDLL